MEIKTFYSDIMNENCFACITNSGIFVVDPGSYTKELKAFVNANKQDIKYILLTHRHFDHLLGVADLLNDCPYCKTVIHRLDANGLFDANFSMATMFGLSQKSIYPDITVDDGDIVKMGDFKIRVMHTPGHTSGSVCYLLEDVIFSGDTLFTGSIGRTDFESGNSLDMAKSLDKLKALNCDYEIFAGHGESTTLFFEKQNNYYMNMIF